jgi:predicted phosphodiesterase
MVLLSGDHTDFGSVQENQFCFDGIEEIEKPIIAVSGNHDSGSTMQHLQDNFGVVTLDDSSATVAGVNIFGRGDNSHSPSMSTEADHGAQQYIEAPARTDVLLAARPATAKLYEGEVPTLVAGDTHKQEIKEMDKSVFVNPGTAGAAFLRAFEKEPAARRTISVLYLHPDTKDPVAIVEYDLGEIGQLELSVNTCTVVDRDDNLKVVC